MSLELKILKTILVFFFTLFSTTYANLILKESATFSSTGLALLTNTKKHSYGQALYDSPVSLKNSSFTIEFFFAIVPEHKHKGSHGMTFVLSPTRHLPGASSDQYLGLFNETNNGKSSNNVIVIELDNHVGININGLNSIVSASAGYYVLELNFDK